MPLNDTLNLFESFSRCLFSISRVPSNYRRRVGGLNYAESQFAALAMQRDVIIRPAAPLARSTQKWYVAYVTGGSRRRRRKLTSPQRFANDEVASRSARFRELIDNRRNFLPFSLVIPPVQGGDVMEDSFAREKSSAKSSFFCRSRICSEWMFKIFNSGIYGDRKQRAIIVF